MSTVTAWTPGKQPTTELGLLHNQKGVASIFSHRWNVDSNPDLAFASVNQGNQLPSKVPAVTTQTLPHNITEASCLQCSGEALEPSQSCKAGLQRFYFFT